MQLIAWGLSSSVYDIAIGDLIGEHGVNAWTKGGRNILRLFQFLSVTGMFILAPLTFSYLSYPKLEKTLGFAERTDFLALGVVLVVMLIAGYPVDGLVRLNENLLFQFLGEEGRAWVAAQQEAMVHQTALILESEHWTEEVLAFLIIACLPALAEELLFRGVLQEELQRGLGVVAGLLLTSLLFAITHWQPTNLMGLFFFGLILGLFRNWSGNLWYPIAAHFVNNATVFFMLKNSGLPLSETLTQREIAPTGAYALAFFGVLAGMGLFWWLMAKRA